MKTAVITGANRGIGLELCRQMSAANFRVIALCRTSSEALDALSVEVVEDIDVASAASLELLSEKISSPVDILINNAGMWSDEKLGEFKQGNLQRVFITNSIAPILVAQIVLPHMHEGSKVVMVTSRMGSIADNTSGGRYGYRMSKAALNAASKSLSLDLKERGIAVALIHPGHVATDMGGPQGISVVKATQLILERIEACGLHNSGVFYHANGEELPW